MSEKNAKRCVLVVDDQDNWRELLAEQLEDDLEVTKVATLKEAWGAVLQTKDPPFHVVVTDIRLKDNEASNEDGMHLAELLNRLGDATRVIVVTGYPTLTTVKRALGSLAVYDYLEKVPENGEPFDADGFHDLVCQAAEEAEKSRTDGFTSPRQWILLVGGDPEWRKRIVLQLTDHLYDVDELNDARQLTDLLERDKRIYNLVIFDESVPEVLPDFFGILQHWLPDAKKIMFTDQDIEPVVRLMQDQTIMNVFTVQAGQYNLPEFEGTLHRVFAPEATRYAVAKIFDPARSEQPIPESEPIFVNHQYCLELSLQDARQPGSMAVWLLPMAKKRGRVQFKVFVYAPGAVLDPDAEFYWEIPANLQLKPLKFNIIPQTPGITTLTIELEQDNGWAWRLVKTMKIEKETIS